jgi:hypothetical protein
VKLSSGATRYMKIPTAMLEAAARLLSLPKTQGDVIASKYCRVRDWLVVS